MLFKFVDKSVVDMLNAAVIGVGAMGKNHARVYSELGGVRLAAVADVDGQRANRIASMYAARCGTKAYTNYNDMLKMEKIDIVSIVVPTRMHKQVALDTLKAGINTLVEKPIASTAAEAEEIIRQAEKNGAKLTVGHIERFNPMIKELKNQIKRLGKIYSIEIHRTGPFPTRINDVGVVVDLGVHDFDIMRFILGSDPVRVYAEVQQNVHTKFEDLAKIVVKFDDGAVGTLDINWLAPKKTREIIVLGEKGMLDGDLITQHLEFYKHNSFREYEYEEISKGEVAGPKESVPVATVEPLKLELQSFVDCVANGKEPVVKAEDALAALRMAELAMESAKTKKVVEMHGV